MMDSTRHRVAVLIAAVVAATGIAVGTPLLLRGAETTSSGPASDQHSDASTGRAEAGPEGSAGHGDGSSDGITLLQDHAQSDYRKIESGAGLHVENHTGAPLVLVFPNGDTASVATGDTLVILRQCGEILPVRAESVAGEFIAEHDGPCAHRDQWTIS